MTAMEFNLGYLSCIFLPFLTSLSLMSSDKAIAQEASHAAETLFHFPWMSLDVLQTSSSSVIISAQSSYEFTKGNLRNITWHAVVAPEQVEDFVTYFRSSSNATCLRNVTARWLNISMTPVSTPNKSLSIPHILVANRTRQGKPPPIDAEAVTVKPEPEKARENKTQPLLSPHCANVLFNKSNTLTIPLRDNTTSDEEGLTLSELDAHKLEEVANYTVQKHNCLRASVKPTASNMLRMEWNQEAADQAQEWAEQCSYNHNNETNRTTSLFPCGQNIAYTTPWPFSWNAVINMWFNEEKDYTYGQPNDLHVVGHYTAMTWATTFQLGCAYKDCGGWHFYVCHYCPNGNFGDLSAPYKAGNPCAACPDSCDRGLCTNTCRYSNVYSNCDELEKKYKICSSRFQERLATNCKATCLCPGNIYL
ncbi:hypothetical protein RvY_14899 [Ramazzottius varieornatus]|uniref:ShKT domain-containing protein n=1 Tax=Ramazzottius varieornatus TaxID=947166 RepID=A0A1D1VUF1_RAMVA|nr:hypothetical protein RvY_14899 [Ramazzottius varieornatus]